MQTAEMELNQVIRQTALETNREFRSLYNYDNKGIVEILRYYGDPHEQMDELLHDMERASQMSRH